MKEFITILMLLMPIGAFMARADDQTARENLEKASLYLSKDPSRSVYFARTALEEATATKSQSMMAEAQAMIANAYITLGDYVSSFEYFIEAESNCPKEEEHVLAGIMLGISYSYSKIKDFDNALSYLEKAEGLFKSLKDTASIARCENNRGLICNAMPDNKAARGYFNEALRLNRESGNDIGVAQNLNNMSFLDDSPDTIILWLEEAIRINDSLGRTWALGENYNNLGQQYIRKGDCRKALEALSTARSYALLTNARELLLDNLRYRSEAYAKSGDYSLAYEDLKSFLEKTERQDMTGGLKDIEVSLVKKNMESIRNEKERDEKVFAMRRMVACLIIAMLAVICSVTIVMYDLHRKASRKEVEFLRAQKTIDSQEKELMLKELAFNKKELDNFALYLKSRNEMMSRIREKIRGIYGMVPENAARELKKLSSSISQFNKNNDEAEKMIDKVNSSFIMKLTERHPSLSNSEKRLASLLRIGMTSKEISLILSMEPKSVDMARYRLRKKLDLPQNLNLCEYLGNL